ncbi:DUF4245 family protein [Nocardioides sp. GY 10127]|uniref:DUF4245 family protein n=1 Tax=Nocardioides sp. GY 10127 TaxID=2569762 RepID=UPI00145801BD|nr:DUF4245 family protein [Nocardioides sp. GY 10127]
MNDQATQPEPDGADPATSASPQEPGAMGIPAGRPGRYKRSTNGLVASMVVLVVVVVAAWQAFGLFRTEPTVTGSDVSYSDVVGSFAYADGTWVYPSALPDGWRLNADPLVPTAEGLLDIAMLTSNDTFVGVHVEDEDVEDLLETLVDTAAHEQGTWTLPDAPAGVPSTWKVWTDEGGDTAYTATIGTGGRKKTVVVYGSASTEDLQQVLGLLVASSSASAS